MRLSPSIGASWKPAMKLRRRAAGSSNVGILAFRVVDDQRIRESIWG